MPFGSPYAGAGTDSSGGPKNAASIVRRGLSLRMRTTGAVNTRNFVGGSGPFVAGVSSRAPPPPPPSRCAKGRYAEISRSAIGTILTCASGGVLTVVKTRTRTIAAACNSPETRAERFGDAYMRGSPALPNADDTPPVNPVFRAGAATALLAPRRHCASKFSVCACATAVPQFVYCNALERRASQRSYPATIDLCLGRAARFSSPLSARVCWRRPDAGPHFPAPSAAIPTR